MEYNHGLAVERLLCVYQQAHRMHGALASRIQGSAVEIEEMISHLLSGTNKAVAVMENSQKFAKEGVDQAAKAGDALKSIADSVTQISDMNRQIASAAEE